MLSNLTRFFERHLQAATGSESRSLTFAQKQLAIAALLIEVAIADHIFDEDELARVVNLLERKFSLSQEQLKDLTELAKAESADSASLHQFTSLINRDCSPSEKFELIKAMWEVAYSDKEINKYEEYVIRKVADLIYLSHSDFIRAKSIVKNNLS